MQAISSRRFLSHTNYYMYRVNTVLAVTSLSAAMVILCGFTVGWQVLGQSNRPSENALVFAHAVPGWEGTPAADLGLQKGASSGNMNRQWYSIHRHLLPVAMGFFFVSFSSWSLLNTNITAEQGSPKSDKRNT